MPATQLSDRQQFHAFCKGHLAARPGGGFITGEASRKLLAHVKKYMAKLPLPMRNLESVAIRAMDKLPYRRIDRDVLEKYELIPRNPQYAEAATGDEFGYRSLLAEAIIEGEPKVLVDWDPTWEPVANIPKTLLKGFRDKNRDAREGKRRAKELLERARTGGHR